MFAMRQAEDLSILDHIGAVAGMAVEVDGDTDIVQQGSRLQQLSVIFIQFVQILPGVEHGQRQFGDVFAVGSVRRVKGHDVLSAALQDVRGDQRQIFRLGIIVEEQAFAQAAAGNGQLFTAGGFQQAVDYTRTSQNNISTVAAESSYFTALFQSGAAQLAENIMERLSGEFIVMDLGGGVFAAFLLHLTQGTRRTAYAYQRRRFCLSQGCWARRLCRKKLISL